MACLPRFGSPKSIRCTAALSRMHRTHTPPSPGPFKRLICACDFPDKFFDLITPFRPRTKRSNVSLSNSPCLGADWPSGTLWQGSISPWFPPVEASFPVSLRAVRFTYANLPRLHSNTCFFIPFPSLRLISRSPRCGYAD